MFTLYTIHSKSYYLPAKEIPNVTDAMCVKKTTSDGRVIHVLRNELPGFLKAVFDELHLYSFDQLKYEIDPHRIHNRLNTILNLPPDILRKIISYIGSYETILADTCQKFRNMVPSPRLSMWAAAANAGDLKLLLALKPKPAQIQTICKFALNGSKATEKDRLNILEYFYNKNKYDLKKLPLKKAGANGDLEILQWALRCMSTFFSKAKLSKDVIFAAIENGHLPILIWADSVEKEGFVFNHVSLRLAVIHGHLDIIEWMHNKGLSTNIPHFASLHGHLHVLEWGYINGYKDLDNTVENGAALNRIDIMQWAYDREAPLPPDLCAIAAKHGHFEALEWAYQNKCSLEDGRIKIFAAERGQLKILQWLVEQGEKIDEQICYTAALNGQLAVLQWAESINIIKLWSIIYAFAAIFGHLHVLKWVRESGIPWHWDSVIISAAEGGSVNVLQWAKESGAQIDLNAICEAAATKRQEDVINWAIQNGLDRDKANRALLVISFDEFGFP